MLCCDALMPSASPFFLGLCSAFCTMATSASFHGVVGLQNPSRYQIDRKNYWRYDAFIATPEIGDIRSHLVLTLLLLRTEYVYWMRGQLSVPSLTTKVILRILFTYLPMTTYNLFLMVFAPIQLSSWRVKFRWHEPCSTFELIPLLTVSCTQHYRE
ncbi:hypothetical protein BD769DRAFT_1461840 [Suillus cothurnatus]|nr:hypothetical protein BD769DRAFT_1461840 [Suillus cothurnatus]